MRFLFIILLFPFFAQAQTFFGVASNPADNGTASSTTPSVTPPASMTSGDLVILFAYQRGSATTSITTTGGQTWNTHTNGFTAVANLSTSIYWCRFNGTWAADPVVTFSAGTNTNLVMLVFRPNTSTNIWGVEQSGGPFSYSAAASFTLTSNVITTHNRTVSIGYWATDDDNTWGTLTGSGWSKTSLGAQYRNIAGSDVSSSYAYNIQTTTTTLTQTSQTQTANGNDPGHGAWIVFYEDTPPSITRRVTIIQ